MEITREDFENLIDQLYEHAFDSASLDVFAEGAEIIFGEFGINIREPSGVTYEGAVAC